MKGVFVLCALVALVMGGPTKTVDKTFLEKQDKLLSLFYHIYQHSHLPEHEEIIKTFKVEDHMDAWPKPEYVEHVLEHYRNGFQLPRDEIFSLAYPEHMEQAIAVFEFFYYAKDFETFYKSAVISRHYLNQGLFLYAYSVALIHRPDCYGIILPPIYEIYPHYFFTSDVMTEVQNFKQMYNGEKHTYVEGGKFPGPTIMANYSGYYLNLHPEQSMSYYLEDVGINSFYYYYTLYYPFWMDGKTYGLNKDYRGEMWYFINQQLLSRYYLERLSNGKGSIPNLDWEVAIETPFYPSLTYPNGLPFPERPAFARVSDYFFQYGERCNSHMSYSYTFIKDFTHRLSDAIDRGYIFDKEGKKIDLFSTHGLDILSNMIQANPDSPDNRFYGPFLLFARHVLGYSYNALSYDRVAPSALEHAETTLRDPMFYQLYKKVFINYFFRYQHYLKPYTKKELTFPGVEIQKIEMDRLITYFEEFYTDLTQGVFYSPQENKEHNGFFARAKQYRLTHKPFTYKLFVNSDKDTKAVVKVFIGPKYDEYGRYINITYNRINFFEIDKFVYDLKTGDNVIKRSSLESKFFGDDRTSFYDLYRQVTGALKGEHEFSYDYSKNFFMFPRRYMLPKGTMGGFPYQFYFIVYPFDKPYTHNKPTEWTYGYPMPGMGGPFIDEYPLFYPFDRPIKYGKMFYLDVPNFYFYETKIYHKENVNTVTDQ